MTIVRYMRIIATCLALLLAQSTTEAKTPRKVSISLFAGSPKESGDSDGKDTHARFEGASQMCADVSGNLFVASITRGTIRKVLPSRMVITFTDPASKLGVSPGAAPTVQVIGPCGLDTDGSGNIYVADLLGETIRKITPDRLASNVAGGPEESGYRNGIGSEARFRAPWGLAIDRSGNIYVVDSGNCVIRKITPDGMVSTLAGRARKCHEGVADGIGPTATFDKPRELAIDANGTLYVVEDNVIRKVTPTGLVTTFAGAFGQKGNVDATGASARFDEILGVTTDPAGNIYVADSRNNTIRKITPEGVVSTLVRVPGYPTGVAYDRVRKRLFVAVDSAIYVVTF